VVTKAETTRKRNTTPEQCAKRDCLKLVVYNLPPIKTIEMITHVIKEKMGEKNVVDIFYHNSDGEKHSGKTNIECSSPIVYRQYLDKTIAMLGKYIEFTPHPRSLEGTAPPTEEDIKKFGFCDNNQALVDTLEMPQAPVSQKKTLLQLLKELWKMARRGSRRRCTKKWTHSQ
jgi:hypothetical protein